MAATTEALADVGSWLARQTPGWFLPVLRSLALAEGVAIVVAAWWLAAVVESALIQNIPAAALSGMFGGLAFALLSRAAIGGLRRWLVAGVSTAIRHDLRSRLLHAVAAAGPLAAPPGGEFVTLIDEQIESLDRYYGGALPLRTAAMIVPTVVLVAVLATDWLAGLLLAVSAPLIPLFMALISMGAAQAARDQQARLAALGGWFLDRVRGAATLRLFRAEQRTLDDVETRTDELRRSTMKVLRLAFLSSAVMEFFSAVAIAAVAIYVGLGLFGAIEFGPADQLSLSSGLFVLLLAPEFFAPLRALAQAWHDRAEACAAGASVLRVLQRPPIRAAAAPVSVDRSGPAAFKPRRSAGIELRDLGFGYPGRAPLFTDLDLVIEPGQRVVLVGPSGGGKSTLIALIAGFLVPDRGQILIDGEELQTLDTAARAARIAWLGQRPWLFQGSIADNIALGDAELGRPYGGAVSSALAQVAATAGVREFSERLPDGLDSAVGEGGYGLSGGQAQRVALARALLRPRPLILLDEPTASLDPDSERAVLSALARALADSPATVVCASHRAGLIDWADRVIEVDGGRLSERAP